jgi:hypothetical protein
LLYSASDIGYLLRTLRNTFLGQRGANARHPQNCPIGEKAE